jgi:hypothetical protein
MLAGIFYLVDMMKNGVVEALFNIFLLSHCLYRFTLALYRMDFFLILLMMFFFYLFDVSIHALDGDR